MTQEPSSKAAQLFSIGEGYYSQNHWEEAIHYYQAAINLDSSHFEARLQLGKSMLKASLIPEALVELEEAYSLNPKATHSTLVKALIARARSLIQKRNDEDALAICDRILELDPNNGPAYQIKMSIWVRRGDVALLKDDLESAAVAYREAGDESRAEHVERMYRWQSEADLESKAKSLELEGKWGEAADLYKKLIVKALDEEIKNSWRVALDRCQQEVELNRLFNHGMAAFDNREWGKAQQLFLQILNIRLDYRKEEQWVSELLDQAVKYSSSRIITAYPKVSPREQLAPIISDENAKRMVRLARLGIGKIGHGTFDHLDGYVLISSSIGISIYHPQSFDRMRVLEVDGWISCFAVSFDGSKLASGSNDGMIQLWQLQEGTLVRKLRGHARKINQVVFSPSGTWLASASDDGAVRIWETGEGRTLRVLEGRLEAVEGIAMSPDEKLLAIIATDQIIRLRRLPDGLLTHALSGHQGIVRCVAFSPGGRYLASGANNGEVLLWDVKDGSILTAFEGFTSAVRGLAFSPGGEYLAVGTRDGKISFWHPLEGHHLQTLNHPPDVIHSFGYSPSGDLMISTSSDNRARLWRVRDGALLNTFEDYSGKINSITFSPNGRNIVSGLEEGTVTIWDVMKGKREIGLKGHLEEVFSVAYSPNGTYLASAGGDRSIKIWLASNGSLVQSFDAHEQAIQSLTFSQDGDTLVSGSRDGTLRLWRVSDWRLVRTFSGAHSGAVLWSGFSSHGPEFVSIGKDGGVRVWHKIEWHLIQSLGDKNTLITAAILSKDDESLICGTEVGDLLLWKMAEDWDLDKRIHTGSLPITSLAVSRISGLLAVGIEDGTIQLWGGSLDSPIFELKGHRGSVTSLDFSPDGSLLASASTDGVILLWGLIGE